MDFVFPAGDESDGSNDEWDVGYFSKKTSPNTKVTLEDVHYVFSYFSLRFVPIKPNASIKEEQRLPPATWTVFLNLLFNPRKACNVP